MIYNPEFLTGTIVEKARFLNIFRQMTVMDKSGSPLQVLVKMQTEQGIDRKTAEENAMVCMAAVAGREAVAESLSENTALLTDRFFTCLKKSGADQRLDILQKTLFGLTFCDNPDAPGFAGDPEQMFLSFRAGCSDNAEVLEDQIRQAIARYRVSPVAMHMLVRKLKKEDGCLAAAMAVGQRGRNLKCLMTMELWLKKKGTVSMEASANAACTGVDYQAAADAVRGGFITKEVACKILKFAAIAAIVVGVGMMVSGLDTLSFVEEGLHLINTDPTFPFTMSELRLSQLFAVEDTANGLKFLLAGGAAAALSKSAAELAGSLISWISGLFQPAQVTASAMESLADTLAADQEDVALMGFDEEMGEISLPEDVFLSVDGLPGMDTDGDIDPVFA